MSRMLGTILLMMLIALPVVAAEKTAVLVIDVQSCFVEGGALAVAGADAAYVNDAQQATKWLYQKGLLIFGSRDYHPHDHISFYTNHPGAKPFDLIYLSPDNRPQVLWPPHCVQTVGDSRELIDNNLFFELIKKGQNPLYDSYSAFRDDHGSDSELDALLQAQGVKHLIVYGIATDYCVLFSVLDALRLGYSVTVVQNLIRGVAPNTSTAAIAAMEAAGAVFVPSVKAVLK